VFGLKAAERNNLTGLRFANDSEFRRAARIAAAAKMPVDAPGDNTLIVRSQDIREFKGLSYSPVPIAIADKVCDSERASLRRRIR